jgi:glycosyltransferase involved in cell wall biosynthesis
MRIGYEYVLPGGSDTGVEIAIRQLLSAIVHLESPHAFEVYARKDSASHIPKHPNVNTHVSPVASLGRSARIIWQQTVLPASLHFRPVDVYHATGYVASPLLPVPTVLSVYDMTALDNPDMTRKTNAMHYGLTIPASIWMAQRVIVPTNYVKERVVSITGIASERIEVISLGINKRFRKLEGEAIKERLESFASLVYGKYILSVGNLEPKKNLTTLLRSFGKLPKSLSKDLKLVLVGSEGPEKKRLVKLASEMGIAEQVVFMGYVNDEILVALYNQAELLAYPSFDEGFGFPPLEAMACGTPVIVSNAGALPETVGDAAILCDPDESAAWAAAIKQALMQPPFRQVLCRKGFERAQQFTWNAAACRTMEVYKEVAQEKQHAELQVLGNTE